MLIRAINQPERGRTMVAYRVSDRVIALECVRATNIFDLPRRAATLYTPMRERHDSLGVRILRALRARNDHG